ncbi:hypothetical protein [Sphingomonas endolithica]|nr:hypothetical protein [Sphingomonas sp. ZFBP2030]
MSYWEQIAKQAWTDTRAVVRLAHLGAHYDDDRGGIAAGVVT